MSVNSSAHRGNLSVGSEAALAMLELPFVGDAAVFDLRFRFNRRRPDMHPAMSKEAPCTHYV